MKKLYKYSLLIVISIVILILAISKSVVGLTLKKTIGLSIASILIVILSYWEVYRK